MNQWLARIMQAVMLILVVAGAVRLAWELLRPAAPALIVAAALLVVLRIMLGRMRGW